MKKLAALLALPFALSACDGELNLDVDGLANQPYRDFASAVMNPANICSDIKVAKSTGGVIRGTRDCKIPENLCTKTGQSGCYIVDPTLYGMDPDDLKPENIREGVKIADVTGNLIANDSLCTGDGQNGCVATETYPSVATASATAKVATGKAILGEAGEYTPDLPELAHVLTTATVAGQPGELPICSAAVTTECVLSTTYRAVPVAALVPADIKQNSVIGAVTGSYITSSPDCTASNVTGCVTTARYAAVDKSRVIANNLQTGYQVLGVNGSVLPQHSACTSDDQTACLATAPYKAVLKSSLSAGVIRSGVTIAGVTGDYPSATFPLPNADAGIHDLTPGTFNSRMSNSSDFELWDATGTRHVLQGSASLAANRIAGGIDIFDVTGSLGARPADCSADGQDGCVTVAGFPAIKKSTVTGGVLRKGVTLAGVTGTYPSAATPLAADTTMADLDLPNDLARDAQVEFFDATGARHVVRGSDDLTGPNILGGVTLFGVNGSAVAKPVACSGQDGVGCVADTSYPAYKKSDLTPEVVKKDVTIGSVTGNFPSASSRLLGASDTDDLTSGNFQAKIANPAAVEFWDATGARHTVNGDADLAATNILNGVTIFGIAGGLTEEPLPCSLTTRGCLTTATYPSYDPAVLAEGLIKSGVKIGEVTGDYPSATYKLPGAQAGTNDLTSGSFHSRLASASAFEYWDSTGTRFTAVGDADLAKGNLRQGTTLFGVTGTAIATSSTCSAANADGCVTTTAYPAYEKSRLSGSVIKKGTSILGVTGTYPSASNPLVDASGTKDLNSGNFASSMADSTSFEYWTSAGVRQSNQGDTDLIEGHLTQGTTFYGVAGSIASTPAMCTTSNQTGCAATASFPAIDISEVTEGVLKKGVMRLGITGKYPSAEYPLANATTTPDLTSGTFTARMQSASTFEYFDSSGNRHTNSGDSDLQAHHIQSGASILGVNGSFGGLSPDTVWDIVYGTSIDGAAGRVKTNCRNLSYTAGFAGDGGRYASIDDQNWFNQSQTPSENLWGIDGAACDADLFLDLSVNSDGDTVPCKRDDGSGNLLSNPPTCMHKDRISGLTWHQASNTLSKMTWQAAVNYCNNLTTGGHNDWRLPTQKEALAAAAHGIHRLKNTFNFTSEAGQTYRTNYLTWTSTGRSTSPNQKIAVYMALGEMSNFDKNGGTELHSHCVRSD